MQAFRLKSLTAIPQYRWVGPLAACAVLWAALCLSNPRFASLNNLSTLLEQFAITAILGCGMTFVILAGGIDLSVGSIIGFAGAVTALAMPRWGIASACALGIAAGAMIGLINGLLIAYGRVAPFIATLGTMGIARSLTLVVLQGKSVSKLPDEFVSFDFSSWAGVPYPALLVTALYASGIAILGYSAFGRRVYALGGNESASRLSGVPVQRVKTAVYLICGLTAGVAAVLTVSRTASAQPQAGSFAELNAIAAVVVGGASLVGGVGSLHGTLIGAFLLQTLQSGLNQNNVNPFWQQAAIGIAIVLAALLDRLSKRRD